MSASPTPNLILKPGTRVVLLLCFTVVMFLLVSIAANVILSKTGVSTPALRILSIVQDVFVFIAPALITALMVTRMPATLLAIDVKPDRWMTVLALLTMIASIPALNTVIAWNESITFPAGMESVEDLLRKYESNAAESVRTLLGGDTWGDLVMGLLITAVAAAFSEELYFRGAMQRMLTCGGINIHAGIWIAALVFSMFHMQFFGFVPRLLLGVYFGYLLYWSRCLWIPVIAHMFNNALYVVSHWISPNADAAAAKAMDSWALTRFSVVLTICGLYLLYRRHRAVNGVARR